MASSSSSSPSIPAFSSRSWKHHVFLSFRGEDTRNNFVGHLYTALENKGIHTYKDDKKLSLGEAINPSLIEAIEQSQLAIIVFSKHYADSSWCLNELRHIMKCRKERGLIAVPIFYDVEPSEVRKQEKKYGEAFVKYELQKNTNVTSWREALVEASGNSGQDFKSGNMDESELIKNIVNKISKMKCPLTPRVNDKLVGVEARMETLISKLQIGSDCVLMIGIWGVGGGGKTTLATSVYRRISWEFDGCCCIENIKDESSKNGLATLQKKIISGVLKEDKVWVESIEEGKDMIRDSFSGKKVLIVLDDVHQRDQLEALAGSVDWFGKGSRILITTRNEHLLKAHKVDVHNISLLDNDEATKLLQKCAGLDHTPTEDYRMLSKKVVSYACGLPLALTVLGTSLFDKSINEWKSTLAKLKKIPDDDIVGKLRISYDGLEKVEQDLFLDIACFFRRTHKDKAMPMLEACGLYPDIGLKVLRERALITISDEVVDMHDLVQEMGHHIVRGEHPDNPEKHSRIWKEEDVLAICAMDATTDLDKIEAIQYKRKRYSRSNQLQHLPPIVANTKNLRWIDWVGDLTGALTPYPQTKLSSLISRGGMQKRIWKGHDKVNVPQRKLCCLVLQGGIQKRLWKGYKFLPNLKIMKLWFLKNLFMLTNFDGLQNLEVFELFGSPKLQEIDSSFGLLENLVFLSIGNCWGIKIFPSINRLKILKTLSFQGCPRLFKLSEIQQKIDNLSHQHMDSVGKCCFPHTNVNHHTRLLVYHADLTKLDLRSCRLRDEDISSSEWELPHLQELDLSHNNFTRLDFSRWLLPRLKWLGVSLCTDLVELSNLPSSIAIVDVRDCSSLKWFGDTSNCKWLWNVSISKGYKLESFHGERLINSMLQGNAIEDHFINVIFQHQIPKGFVGRFFKGKTFISRRPHDNDMFTLHLPDDWYNDFCGFLVRVVNRGYTVMDIIMKHEAGEEDSRFDIWQESNEEPEPEYDGKMMTYVGYVSFNSLRRTTSLNSSYNIISFSIENRWSSFAAELVPMKSKDDAMQTRKATTNCTEFWDDKEEEYDKSFKIHQNLKSDIKISWYAE